jgi:hypothetical protein
VNYESSIRHYLVPHIGEVPLAQLTVRRLNLTAGDAAWGHACGAATELYYLV